MPMSPPLTNVTKIAPLRILVADDNEMLGAAVRGLLQSLGHSVDVVGNGLEAVESSGREVFDFVFMDIQMPVMDGLEAARSMRAQQASPSLPRIIGFSAERLELETYQSVGMDDFLLKPIRLADLVRAMKDRIAS